MRLATKLRDWWRGYSDGDVVALRTKWQNALLAQRPGALVMLTSAEHRALCDGNAPTVSLLGVQYLDISDPAKQ
jgi:hypothetical protein